MSRCRGRGKIVTKLEVMNFVPYNAANPNTLLTKASSTDRRYAYTEQPPIIVHRPLPTARQPDNATHIPEILSKRRFLCNTLMSDQIHIVLVQFSNSVSTKHEKVKVLMFKTWLPQARALTA